MTSGELKQEQKEKDLSNLHMKLIKAGNGMSIRCFKVRDLRRHWTKSKLSDICEPLGQAATLLSVAVITGLSNSSSGWEAYTSRSQSVTEGTQSRNSKQELKQNTQRNVFSRLLSTLLLVFLAQLSPPTSGW